MIDHRRRRALPLSRSDPDATALVVIDMQRDFVEPGGFGAALGNDVSRLGAIVPTVAALIALFRGKGWPVIHTREAHLPDLSDCPPAKRRAATRRLRIGERGADGPPAGARASRATRSSPSWRRSTGEIVIDKPGKGTF